MEPFAKTKVEPQIVILSSLTSVLWLWVVTAESLILYCKSFVSVTIYGVKANVRMYF